MNFPSLPSGSWLQIAIGFLFGVISTIFVIEALNQLKKSNSVKSLIGILALYSAAMTVASLIYTSGLSGGLLVEWQLLQYPEKRDRAVKILDIGYFQGKSGNIYKDNQGILERVDAISQNGYRLPVKSTKSICRTLPFLPIRKADFVASNSACLEFESSEEKIVYAIDSRGHAYSWRNKVYEFDVIGNAIFALVGGTVSCVLGVIVLLLLAFSIILKKNLRKNIVQSNSGV